MKLLVLMLLIAAPMGARAGDITWEKAKSLLVLKDGKVALKKLDEKPDKQFTEANPKVVNKWALLIRDSHILVGRTTGLDETMRSTMLAGKWLCDKTTRVYDIGNGLQLDATSLARECAGAKNTLDEVASALCKSRSDFEAQQAQTPECKYINPKEHGG